MSERLRRWSRLVAASPIIIYQKIISPAIPSRCIYTPTCSQYGKEAILTHGFLKGMALLLSRVFRCSALFAGGYDPVPAGFSFKRIGFDYKRRFRRGTVEDEPPEGSDDAWQAE